VSQPARKTVPMSANTITKIFFIRFLLMPL
jgi:hypothetical protein